MFQPSIFSFARKEGIYESTNCSHSLHFSGIITCLVDSKNSESKFESLATPRRQLLQRFRRRIPTTDNTHNRNKSGYNNRPEA